MRYLLTFVMLAVLAVPAYAAFEGPNSGGQSMGGFQGPTGGAHRNGNAQEEKQQCQYTHGHTPGKAGAG